MLFDSLSHNLKVAGSNPAPATTNIPIILIGYRGFSFPHPLFYSLTVSIPQADSSQDGSPKVDRCGRSAKPERKWWAGRRWRETRAGESEAGSRIVRLLLDGEGFDPRSRILLELTIVEVAASTFLLKSKCTMESKRRPIARID